ERSIAIGRRDLNRECDPGLVNAVESSSDGSGDHVTTQSARAELEENEVEQIIEGYVVSVIGRINRPRDEVGAVDGHPERREIIVLVEKRLGCAQHESAQQPESVLVVHVVRLTDQVLSCEGQRQG